MKKNTLNGRKFVFFSGSSGRDKMMIKIAKQLASRNGVKTHFLTFTPGQTVDYFVSEGIKSDCVTSVLHLPNPAVKPDMAFLKSKEIEYGVQFFDIWQIAAARSKKRHNIKSTKVLAQMEFFVRELEHFIKKVKPDYLVVSGVSSYVTLLAYKIFMKKGLPVLEITNPRIPNRFAIDDKLKSEWPLLVKKYEEIKNTSLKPRQRKEALDFMQSFYVKPLKSDNQTTENQDFSQRFARYFRHIKTLYYRRRLPALRVFWTPIKDFFLKNSSRFELPVDGEKFVFHPLQIQPEVSTLLKGKWYVNQVALIENIAKSLPCDYKLYVKEHVKNYSQRPPNFHRDIKRFPNVRLIAPSADTIWLAKKCSLVTTITGTIGWEAILLRKPVLTFGQVFYNQFEEVVSVVDIKQLPNIIKSKLDTVVDLEKTLQFVSAVQQSTFPGIRALPTDCRDRSLKDENILALTQGLEQYIYAMNL